MATEVTVFRGRWVGLGSVPLANEVIAPYLGVHIIK